MNMNDSQKASYRDMAETFHKLPEQKQERAIGIMQGMLMMAEECKTEQDGSPVKQ